MKFINAKNNDVYYVDVYLMNEDYETVECSVVQGKLEEIKEYYLNKYSGLRTKHGIAISKCTTNYDDTVWFKEDI